MSGVEESLERLITIITAEPERRHLFKKRAREADRKEAKENAHRRQQQRVAAAAAEAAEAADWLTYERSLEHD
jgi:uncharacterized membrane protein